MTTTWPSVVEDQTFLDIMANTAATVTVVTAFGAAGTPHGCTVSAFCSVSRTPPLVLVSIATPSRTLDAIAHSGGYTVNLLTAGEGDVAMHFARAGHAKFAGVEWRGPASSFAGPVLIDANHAHLECTAETSLEAGDHLLVVGRVTHGERGAGSCPLVHWRRSFVELDGAAHAPRSPSRGPGHARPGLVRRSG